MPILAIRLFMASARDARWAGPAGVSIAAVVRQITRAVPTVVIGRPLPLIAAADNGGAALVSSALVAITHAAWSARHHV